ncbi:MAG TPA: DEAD/DEAH box helicase family protein [Ardenticatenaceae bacterium]|jgi:superfamily II DNA or RNA helicase
MPRPPLLRYDKGTLILHPPPRGGAWVPFVTWDDRVERFRLPAPAYAPLLHALRADGVDVTDQARAFREVSFHAAVERTPWPHQDEALRAWVRAGRRGVVALPTAAGKTFLAQMAMQATPRSTLVLVPTKPLLDQWYRTLKTVFPELDIGVLGGGDRDGLGADEPPLDVLVSTYDSAAIHAETLGNRYALLVFDECHHLPTDFYRTIAEFSIAPYRLGLSATPERSDGRHADLDALIGPIVYERAPEDLAGVALADYEVIQLRVRLLPAEQEEYEACLETRNLFLRERGMTLGGENGYVRFMQASAQSSAGREAMLAHLRARALAFGTERKLDVLASLLEEHWPARTIIFTHDNALAHTVSERFLIPAITHETTAKERHAILERFAAGTYSSLVTSRVLNEGIDVPNASIGVVLSGTGSRREHVQRLGRFLRRGDDPHKRALLYEVVAEGTGEENTAKRRRRPEYHVSRVPDGPVQDEFEWDAE